MRNILSDDALRTFEPIPPDVVRGRCSCECCENDGKSLFGAFCPKAEHVNNETQNEAKQNKATRSQTKRHEKLQRQLHK